MNHAAALLLSIAIVAACSGSDDDSASPATSDPGEPDDALVTITPVTPETTVAAPPADTTSTPPPTTRPPIQFRTFPDPGWAAVEIPTAPPVEPTAVNVLADQPPSTRYDISPDGNWLALIDDANALCLEPVADVTERVCAEGVDPTRAAWAPDSSRVVFYRSSMMLGRSGPLGLLATDGTVVTLLETGDPEDPFGGATASGFVDTETVIFTRMRVDPSDSLTYEVHTVGVDGSDDAVIGTIDIGSGTDVFLPEAELFDETTVHFVPNGLSVVPGAWRFEPTADAIGVIAPVEPDARYSAQPVDVAGGLLVTVDAERIGSFTSNRAEAQFFTLSAIDRSASVAIDDLDPDYMILSAALSPDGAHLAVFEYYRGDDTMVANSEASGRVSIAPTASLFQGDPTWATLDGIGPGAPSLDLDRGFSTITWPSTDHVYVELLDRAFAVDVVPS